MLAKVLVTGDVSLYKPTKPAEYALVELARRGGRFRPLSSRAPASGATAVVYCPHVHNTLQEGPETPSGQLPRNERLIARVGPCTLEQRGEDPFTLLVRCVIGQQISTKAADSIYTDWQGRDRPAGTAPGRRHVARDAAGRGPIPLAKLAKFTEAKYKSCGVSGPKQRTLRA